IEPLRIRAHSEHGSWEVASPEGVIWRVEATGVSRPAVKTHFAVVERILLRHGTVPPKEAVTLWEKRGMMSARWLGPPPMDTELRPGRLERWVLSLTPGTTRSTAKRICAQAQSTWKSPCNVYARIDLPPVGRGILTAENSSFSKEFEGFLELISP